MGPRGRRNCKARSGHRVGKKAGGEVFRCSLSGRASGRWLEIPAWMFDRAARATWRVGAAPHVDIAVLSALATLLQDVTVTKRPRLPPPLFGRSIAWLADRRRDPTPINNPPSSSSM
jgi:hypothetical protein